jgi:dihydrolipoamide dehydrogenase
MADRFDLVVIGAGPGGYVAAIRAAQLGMKVACIDRRATLGGTCLNIGCIPSKALLDSSELYSVTKSKLAVHGVEVSKVGLDLKKMLERKDKVVKGLTDGVAYLFKKNKITPIHGSARLAGRGRVIVKSADKSETTVEASNILLATGSEPMSLPGVPFDGESIVSSTEALSFDKVPSHFIVVGGSYIGLELGSVWSRLGSKVTVVEFLPHLVPTGDREMTGLLHKTLVKQGLTFQLETKITSAVKQKGKVTVTGELKGEKIVLEGDKVLIAIGRKPVTAGLGLEEIGVAVEPRSGRITVDENFRTSAEGIYAIGDLIAGPMLAHKAQDEGIAFAERLAGNKAHVNYAAIPGVIYTWPELASVGATEEELKQKGIDYRVGRFPFAANGRARCMGETEGLVKMLADARSDRMLGVHILGPRASDMIAEGVLALEFSASSEDVARTSHAHPTLSEAFREAALAVDGRAIHA